LISTSERGAINPDLQPSWKIAGVDMNSIARKAPSISLAPLGMAKWKPPSDEAWMFLPSLTGSVVTRQSNLASFWMRGNSQGPPTAIRLVPRHERIRDVILLLVDHIL